MVPYRPWHGASYTFIVWGMLHGLYLIVFRLLAKPRKKLMTNSGVIGNNKVIAVIESCTTLILIMIAWVFFRSDSVDDALNYLRLMFSRSIISLPEIFESKIVFLIITVFAIAFFVIEWFGRKLEFAIANINHEFPAIARLAIYYLIVIIIFFFAGSSQEFIYFQF